MPGYLDLHRRGELALRARKALDLSSPCRCCPRQCRVDRLRGEVGLCLMGRRARVASYGPHFGEEAPLVGAQGSGAVFFSGCNLRCAFCQNHDISHFPAGQEVTPRDLAGIMVQLQESGCHNINIVTPSHVLPQILEALLLAADMGLNVPLVYNSSGYDSLEALTLLRGVVDIYMPDVKFWDKEVSSRLCSAGDYPERTREAVREMHSQVGDLALDRQGVARQGLLVRHLVLPRGLAGTREWMRFLAKEISPGAYINLMDQYRPCGRVAADPDLMPELSRPLTADEFHQALEMAREQGLTRLDDRESRQAMCLVSRLLGRNFKGV